MHCQSTDRGVTLVNYVQPINGRLLQENKYPCEAAQASVLGTITQIANITALS